MRRFRLSILFLFLATPAVAAPSITSWSGSLSNGSTLTISGSLFGTKSATYPLVRETFDGGAVSSKLAKNGITTSTMTTNLRHAYDVYNATFDYKSTSGGGGGGLGYFSYNVAVSSKWFVQYWVHVSSAWVWNTNINGPLGNVKFFRMYPTGARDYTNIGYVYHGDAGTNNGKQFFENNTVDNRNEFNFRATLSTDTWHLVQIEYNESNSHGYDGSMKLWIDGVLKASSATIRTNFLSDGATIGKRPFIVGLYDSHPPSVLTGDIIASYDDVVVDSTPARVELSTCSTYTGCSREYQLTTSWTESGVNFVYSQGSIPTGRTVYAYLTDENGVQSSAFELTATSPLMSTSGPIKFQGQMEVK